MVNETESSTVNNSNGSDSELPTVDSPNSLPEAPSEYSLREEIRRGWEWVVFVWQVMRRIGGPKEILQALATLTQLLLRRTLTQWGLLRDK